VCLCRLPNRPASPLLDLLARMAAPPLGANPQNTPSAKWFVDQASGSVNHLARGAYAGRTARPQHIPVR
jgi:hypothetical protein